MTVKRQSKLWAHFCQGRMFCQVHQFRAERNCQTVCSEPQVIIIGKNVCKVIQGFLTLANLGKNGVMSVSVARSKNDLHRIYRLDHNQPELALSLKEWLLWGKEKNMDNVSWWICLCSPPIVSEQYVHAGKLYQSYADRHQCKRRHNRVSSCSWRGRLPLSRQRRQLWCLFEFPGVWTDTCKWGCSKSAGCFSQKVWRYTWEWLAKIPAIPECVSLCEPFLLPSWEQVQNVWKRLNESLQIVECIWVCYFWLPVALDGDGWGCFTLWAYSFP